MLIGTIQTMRVVEQTTDGFVLSKGTTKVTLPNEEISGELSIDNEIDVFLYENKATMKLPKLSVGFFDWVTVKSKKENIGVYIDIESTENVFIPKNHLPALPEVWPNEDDQLYVTLDTDRRDRLIAIPAKEADFTNLFAFAYEVDLNERIIGRVIRADREGTVIITKDNYRGFIHRTERGRKEPRLGELVTGRIIEVKEDGTLNVSLKPLKHERMDDDAQAILQYLQDNDGEMEFGDRSSPEQIRTNFQMSKSAFKRALGRLMKQRSIKQRDGKTFLTKK